MCFYILREYTSVLPVLSKVNNEAADQSGRVV
jgi:hypothetical protein